MRIERNAAWAAALSWSPPAAVGGCPYVGIMIGADSDEGEVLVSGGGLVEQRLVAGRPLMLAASQYKITRVHPVGTMAAVAILEVVMFERYEELAMAGPRAPKLYSTVLGGVSVASEAAYTELLRIPFVNRRKARVSIRGTAAGRLHSVRIAGEFYSVSRGAVQSHILVEDALVVETDDTIGELAVYVGGTNEAEEWAVLVVSAQLDVAGAENVFCDGLVSGEGG